MPTSRHRLATLTLVVSVILAESFANPVEARDANGKGTLHLHRLVMSRYEDFKREFNPKYFAVSTNGLAHGYSLCPEQACMAADSRGLALQSCQRTHHQIEAEAGIRLDGECFIFASAGSIVWDGEIIVLEQEEYKNWLLQSGMVHRR